MILVPAFLLLVAVGLLAGGLAEGSATLQWASFAASLLAALVLAVGEARRRRGLREPERTPAADVDPPASAWVDVPARAAASTAASTGPVAQVPVRQAPPASVAEPGPEQVSESAPAATASAHSAGRTGPATGAHAAAPALGPDGEPSVEEVEVTDLLLVLDLTDEVLVVDEHPRYHLAGCPHLDGADPLPLPMVEARTDGFSPCGSCAPDRHLAARERARRAG